MYSHILRIFSITFLTLTFASGYINSNKLACKLAWQPTGFGQIPTNAVQINRDTNSSKLEYVGRIKLSSGEYKLGRISGDKYLYLINEQKAATDILLSNKESMKGIKTYQILVNSLDDCNITWSEESVNPVQLHRDLKYKNYLVGRVKFAGQFIPGLVNMNTKKIIFTYDGGIYERVMGYQILESNFKKMTLELKNFEFEMPDSSSIQANTSVVLVGESLVEKDTQIYLVHKIEHFKDITEVITILPVTNNLKDDNGSSFLNCHLQTLKVFMDFWYPTKALVHEFILSEELFEETATGVTTQRQRNISTVAEFRAPEGKTELKVTSVASVYKGSILFKAEGIFKSAMSLKSMQELVSNCDLRITSTNLAKNSIHVIVEGILEGNFVTGTKITAV